MSENSLTMRKNSIIWVFITRMENQIPEGYLFSPHLSQYVSYTGEGQLLLMIDQILNVSGGPKKNFELRKFDKSGGFTAAPPAWLKNILSDSPSFDLIQSIPKGVLYSFIVDVTFRYNASWQGRLTDLKNKREESFRSALEMLFLIQQSFVAGGEAWYSEHLTPPDADKLHA